MDCTELKVGDRVWTGESRWGQKTYNLQTVTKVTAKRIILDGHREYNTFEREDGSRYGCSFSRENVRIQSTATPVEVAAWEVKKSQEQASKAKKEADRQAQEDLRNALCSLFPEGVWVGECQHHSPKGQTYEICNLTESEVRKIAEFLK